MKKSLSFLAVLLLATPAAAEPDFIDTFKAWNAFGGKEGTKRLCYVGSLPTKSEGKYTKRGTTYILVTHRPDDGENGVVSITAGYRYKAGSEVTVTIGGESVRLFTNGDHAWASDEATDRKLVTLMKAGRDMVIKGQSQRGTLTTDTYSLEGFTAAYQAASKDCGL
ncbi:MAG: hypothetical protein KDE22_09970 [Rhodobacterales bacterium]|nr:hypothetical protein [Rhodobacterales bacterium]